MASAQSDQPGYVDFGDLTGTVGVEPAVEVSLGPALLRFLTETVRQEEPELAQALGGLRGIRLNVFQLDESGVANAQKRTRNIVERLEADAWEPAVSVRSEDTMVHMYMKMVDDRVAGMTVLTIDEGGEALFMNIVGEIDPAQLGRVASRFGVDLDDIATGDF
ncbi:MAG: DUF4252 domain-containing protein [Pseudomonadota bacterium]